MSLKSTYTNASIRGWTAGGIPSTYPWLFLQSLAWNGATGKIAISGDGNYVVVIGNVIGSGSNSYINIYIKSGTGSTSWVIQKIYTPTDLSNAQLDSVDIDYTGSTIVIGQVNVSGVPDGRAYVYSRSGTTWSLQQTLQPVNNQFVGTSVSISQNGNYIAISNPYYPATNKGTAYVYIKSGSTWSLQQTIIDTITDDLLGASCSITSTNGDLLALGAPQSPFAIGKVYMYTRSGTTWSLQQTLQASDATNGDQFGRIVSTDSTGQYCVVINSSPSAYDTCYVFQLISGTWSEIYKFSLGTVFSSLSISDNADTIVLGEPQQNSNKGQASIFRKTSSTTWSLVETLLYPDVINTTSFGKGVTITNNSNTIGVSAVGSVNFNNTIYVASIFS